MACHYFSIPFSLIIRYKSLKEGILWWSSGKNLPCNAKDISSISGVPWKNPHTVEHKSLCTATAKPVAWALKPQLLSPCAATTEAWAPQSLCLTSEESPRGIAHTAQLEKASTQQRPSAAKNEINKKRVEGRYLWINLFFHKLGNKIKGSPDGERIALSRAGPRLYDKDRFAYFGLPLWPNFSLQW